MKECDKGYPNHMATYEEIRAKLKDLISEYNGEKETKLPLWEINKQVKLLEWVLYANSKGKATLDVN